MTPAPRSFLALSGLSVAIKKNRAYFAAGDTSVGFTIVLAMDAESMQVLSTPGESNLKNPVQLGDTGVAAEQQTPPDERTYAAKKNADLVRAERCRKLSHGNRFPKLAHLTPRNLLLSIM
jgi:hypothetical protein